LKVHPQRMAEALDDGMLATDLADYLVRRDVPFRRSHHLVGQVVRRALKRGVPLRELPLEEFREVTEEFGEDVYQVFDFRRSVEARDSYGGTATQAVRQQLARARERLG
jgi:argininosuccinate lyase